MSTVNGTEKDNNTYGDEYDYQDDFHSDSEESNIKAQENKNKNQIKPIKSKKTCSAKKTPKRKSLDNRKAYSAKPASRAQTGKSVTKSVQWFSSDESSDSTTTDSEQEQDLTRKLKPEQTAEYWDIHKLLRFLKVGNPTVTLIALCALDDMNLDQEIIQISVVDLGGIHILLNLLKTHHISCEIGSLKIFMKLSKSRKVNNEIYRLKGVEQLISCFDSSSIEVQSLAAEVLANFASFRRAYQAVQKHKGIAVLVKILKSATQVTSKGSTDHEEDRQILCKNACNALWSCSRYSKNIEAIRKAGTVKVLRSLLKNGPSGVLLFTVGIIQECSTDASFCDDIRKEGIIEDVVRLLKTGDNALKTLCANAIFKCGEDEETQKLVQKHKGLEPLVEVLTSPDQCSDEKLLCAVIGAMWKCALYKPNIESLENLGALGYLIALLKKEQPLEIEANIIGALSAFAYCRKNIIRLYEEGVVNIAIVRLNLTVPNILINSSRILALCAKENVPRRLILTSDGVRLLWSLLKSSNHKVVASAAYGIAMCVCDAQESAEIVRSLVGGLELVTKLLRSNRREVLISVCQMVINIGHDRENMSIMTDYDIVTLLVSLVNTGDEELHQYVAEAIATCCNLDKNTTALSSTVIPLCNGFATYKSPNVHRTTAMALEKLSNDPRNCFLIQQHGALKHLIQMMASRDYDVQEAAARCIKNVRLNVVRSRQSSR